MMQLRVLLTAQMDTSVLINLHRRKCVSDKFKPFPFHCRRNCRYLYVPQLPLFSPNFLQFILWGSCFPLMLILPSLWFYLSLWSIFCSAEKRGGFWPMSYDPFLDDKCLTFLQLLLFYIISDVGHWLIDWGFSVISVEKVSSHLIALSTKKIVVIRRFFKNYCNFYGLI